jgi:hypothetical protein
VSVGGTSNVRACSRLTEPEEVLTATFGKVLDGIPKHGSWHRRSVLQQEPLFRDAVAFPNLAQHPAHGLVNEVVFVVKQTLG